MLSSRILKTFQCGDSQASAGGLFVSSTTLQVKCFFPDAQPECPKTLSEAIFPCYVV